MYVNMLSLMYVLCCMFNRAIVEIKAIEQKIIKTFVEFSPQDLINGKTLNMNHFIIMILIDFPTP